MAVTYEKLWKLLKEKNMKKIEMQRKAGISGNTKVLFLRNYLVHYPVQSEQDNEQDVKLKSHKQSTKPHQNDAVLR